MSKFKTLEESCTKYQAQGKIMKDKFEKTSN